MSTLYTTFLAGIVAVFALQPPSLTGVWRATLKETDGVELEFRMTVAATKDGWEAFSRQGAARELVGGGTALLGRMFGKMPPREALIYIGKGTVDGDRVRASVDSPFLGPRELTGTLANDRIVADLTRPASRAKAGTLALVRDTTTTPLRDYSALAADLERAMRTYIFDPALLERPAFQRFFEQIAARFVRAGDDLDAIVSFEALKSSLGVSHIDFIRHPKLAAASLEQVIGGDPSSDPATHVRLSFPAPEVAFLRITKWDRVVPAVDRAFEQIDAAKPQVLVLDIRGNSGGDATSMSPLAHLVREPVTVGSFLSRKWYDARRAAPSSPKPALPVLESDASPSQLFAALRDHGGVTGKAMPRAPYFAGTVFLLVDGGTASASEPLAYALKTSRRATLVGEKTAGHMLTALPFGLRDGWVATIPVADFEAANGVRLEGTGVEPDVKAASNEAFLAVADRIGTRLPYSSAVLRGGSYETLERADDAERAYRAAVRVADKQTPAPSAAARATIHKRLANIRKAKGDVEGALREYREVLKLVPDDAEANDFVKGKGRGEKG